MRAVTENGSFWNAYAGTVSPTAGSWIAFSWATVVSTPTGSM